MEIGGALMKENREVLAVLEAYPIDVKSALMKLRALIADVAAETESVGMLEETLKWGQPSYLTARPKSGTTIRIDRDPSNMGDFALYVNCKSSLVSEWRGLFPDLTYGGDRSVHFRLNDKFPEDELRQMIAMALTYHSKKRKLAAKFGA